MLSAVDDYVGLSHILILNIEDLFLIILEKGVVKFKN